MKNVIDLEDLAIVVVAFAEMPPALPLLGVLQRI